MSSSRGWCCRCRSPRWRRTSASSGESAALFDSGVEFAARALVCAIVLMVWRFVQRRREFLAVFDHAAAKLAFWGSLALLSERETRLLGCAIALVLAGFSAWYGFRRREEAFVIYAYVYGTIAVDVQICEWLGRDAPIFSLPDRLHDRE